MGLSAGSGNMPGTNVSINISPDGKVTVSTNGSVVSAASSSESEDEKSEKKEEEKTNALKEFTVEEVARHQSKGDCWVVLNNQVYDVTEFLRSSRWQECHSSLRWKGRHEGV